MFSEHLDLTIRPEQPGDSAAIYAVQEQAFDSKVEPELVTNLQRRGVSILSLVALVNQQIVGHALFTPVAFASLPNYHRAFTLAPLAVLPAFQGRGIGSRLTWTGLELCQARGYEIVMVVGHADYYPRFGFVPAQQFGLHCTFFPPDNPAFMALELRSGALEGKHGLVIFEPEFDATV